ncbi:DUF4157 domain-containing protein [Ferruginibacter sp. HRS2-29]|uniref:DUF4157 domain-containing protein n=1 Tax=Ferruginibacter sp. HRS2-29 TaxID=2487334 RepID=UPI0020CCB74D|nr:DUF4157 domain-containing protein [Ferruginibacter sp. HRS2-29]MCP9752846.1 DUF4157 domain-containing protein [Ferruginibacter sp. HRS2-29]
MTNFRVKENSWIARIAARKLKAASVAIVIGSTIHLYNTSKEDFLADAAWLKHELCHVEQFRRHGFFTFIFKYLVESWKKGYYNNKFEEEAREAEKLAS